VSFLPLSLFRIRLLLDFCSDEFRFPVFKIESLFFFIGQFPFHGVFPVFCMLLFPSDLPPSFLILIIVSKLPLRSLLSGRFSLQDKRRKGKGKTRGSLFFFSYRDQVPHHLPSHLPDPWNLPSGRGIYEEGISGSLVLTSYWSQSSAFLVSTLVLTNSRVFQTLRYPSTLRFPFRSSDCRVSARVNPDLFHRLFSPEFPPLPPLLETPRLSRCDS